MIKSALQSSLTNDVKHSSMSAGAVPSNEYLIATTIVGATPVASIQFDVSAYAGIYKHLQIRMTARDTRSGGATLFFLQLNGDIGANYAYHGIYGNAGGSATVRVASSTTRMLGGIITSATAPANAFGAAAIDILDPFNASKNTTIRSLSGAISSTTVNTAFVDFDSGLWNNTNVLSSIEILVENVGTTFVTGSRFSLYGVTA